MEDEWEVEDIPQTCTTIMLELKPDLGEKVKERKLMDISGILDEAAWDEMTEKAAFGNEAERQKLDDLGARAEKEVTISESVRMSWEENKHRDVLDWMNTKMDFFAKAAAKTEHARNKRKRLLQYAKDGKLITKEEQRAAQKEKMKQMSEDIEATSKAFYDNQKEQAEAHKTARLLRLVREQKLETASDQFVEDTFAFLRFVSVFTIIMLVNRRDNAMVWTWGNNLKSKLENSMYREITDVYSLWDYLEYSVAPMVAGMEYYTGEMKPDYAHGFLLDFNKILGGVRIRQVRGTSGPCTIGALAPKGMTEVIPTCYKYDPSSPGSEAFTKYDSLLGTTSTYSFKSADAIGASRVSSKMTSDIYYPGSGYEQLIPAANIGNATDYVSSLRRQAWTDDDTRALFVEMNLYNPTINRFSVITMLFELPLHGGVMTSTQIQNVKLFKYVEPADFVVMILEFIMIIQLFEFIRIQVTRVGLIGWQEYLSNSWTWFDLINTGTLWCVIQFRIQWLVMVAMLNFNMNTMIDLKSVADMIRIEDQVNSVNALLIYMRAFKFLSLWPRLQKYKDTLMISVPDIMAYWVNVSVIFFAFACTGFVAFGTKVYSFHTLGESMTTMFIYASGQYNFEELKAADSFLGPVISILFMCLVYFCLTCMFMAINCYTYNQVIRGLHLDKADLTSLDGPDLMRVVTEKITFWLEEKIPALREKRLEKEAEERRQAKIAGNRATTKEEQATLLQKIKDLIEICGAVEAFNGLGGFEFYQVTIKEQVQYEEKLTLFEMQEIEAAISKVIKDTQAEGDGAQALMTEEDKKVPIPMD